MHRPLKSNLVKPTGKSASMQQTRNKSNLGAINNYVYQSKNFSSFVGASNNSK